MYLDGLSFLEDERDAWAPYEALDALSDAQWDVPVPAAHGWSARDLAGHLLAWQEQALAAARELAIGETSATIAELDALDWEREGDALNDRFIAEYRALPLDEVRRRFRTIPGELRGYLTVVPETRWVKNAKHLGTFTDETLKHYDGHLEELRAILAAAG